MTSGADLQLLDQLGILFLLLPLYGLCCYLQQAHESVSASTDVAPSAIGQGNIREEGSASYNLCSMVLLILW